MLTSAQQQHTKIVGGEPALPGQFPYQVSLHNDELGLICAGALITPQVVLTAAACTDPRSPSIDKVVAGSLKRVIPVPWEQNQTVNRHLNHPRYNGTLPSDDISLIFLNQPFTLNENVSTIRLPPPFFEAYPNQVILSGWGAVDYESPFFEDLQWVTLDTFTREECEQEVGQHVGSQILCTGARDGGRGGCFGDAGAPIVMEVDGNTVLVAPLSHFPCHREDCKNCASGSGYMYALQFWNFIY